MKVWEKLIDFDKSIGNNREMAIEMCKIDSRCPANIEEKYNLIGKSKFERHCKIGCGVKCVDEYLDIAVREEKI